VRLLAGRGSEQG